MDKYAVKLLTHAVRDLDDIYAYIARSLLVPEVALRLAEEIENAILSLEELPLRGSERKNGAYAGKKYRQLFVKNYTIVYRVDEAKKLVIIVNIRYSPSLF